MIKSETEGDVFEAIENALDDDQGVMFFHGCNAKGVMGAGVARQVKRRWPDVFEPYKMSCRGVDNPEGEVVCVWPKDEDNLVVANAITQSDYGSDGEQYARLSLVGKCLYSLESKQGIIDKTTNRYMAVRVGCGLGGLDWENVRPLFEESAFPWEIYYL